jgi:phosphate starvation-inducible membrane PsiE
MVDQKVTAKADKRMLSFLDPAGLFLTDGFHLLGLFAIGAATVWAAGNAFYAMIQEGRPSIEDLLLLFIYLEIGSMVGIYFRTNHMPVRFLLYVGITALTRHMIGFVQEQSNPRATGEALLAPARNRRSRVDRITGATGKSIEGERVAVGSVVATKRSNVRGAKGPCCL